MRRSSAVLAPHTIAVLVRVMAQAVRDGLSKVSPARFSGWQRQYRQVEDELNDPRALALPDWETLQALAKALAARLHAARVSFGPRGGRISTAVLRDAPTGTTSSPSSVSSTLDDTTCATPD